MEYRKEIDGLRAIAVLSVILFHAGFTSLSGGFFGVDIFFVISGYLITSIILTELKQKTFSLANFYERRARRILPALFSVMAVSLLFSWLWLEKNDLRDFFQSFAAVPIFGSNIHFWSESGYFDTSTELKPLLHTWSLAIEEQYYIIFPLFLIFMQRFNKYWGLSMMATIGILSLILAQYSAYNFTSAAFFLLPSRIWELMAGSILAYLTIQWKINNTTHNKIIQELLALLGIIAIIYAIVIYDHDTPHPSVYTLTPIIGAALIIAFATPRTLVGRLLGSRILVSIGLISYSAYLWHHPIFAFAKYLTPNNLNKTTVVALLLATLILAYISWRYIEQPFRKKGQFDRKFIKTTSIALSIVFILIGLAGAHRWTKTKSFDLPLAEKAAPPTVMLLGDSHAQHLFPGLRHELGAQVVDYSLAGCIPFYDVNRYDRRSKPHECSKAMNQALGSFESKNNFKAIILASMGPVYLDGTTFKGKDPARVREANVVLETDLTIKNKYKVFEIGMRNTLKKLSATGKKIIFVLDVPELGIEGRFCNPKGKTVSLFGLSITTKKPMAEKCFVTRDEYNKRTSKYKNLVLHVLRDYPNIIFFDPTNFFCNTTRCRGILDGKNLYRDADHLSDFGSLTLAKTLAPIIKETLQ